jgi:hypothetical protein
VRLNGSVHGHVRNRGRLGVNGSVHGTIEDERKGAHEIHEGETIRLEPGTQRKRLTRLVRGSGVRALSG